MKFFVKDEEGNKFEVEEIEEMKKSTEDDGELAPELTPEEIGALKKLAAVADKIMDKLVAKEDSDDFDEDEKKSKEIVVDTDEEEDDKKDKVTDSKKSFGAIQKKIVVDSADDINDEVSAAWAKRYGGNK